MEEARKRYDNFNCTIQELKPLMYFFASSCRYYFNCTIQELKPNSKEQAKISFEFQLHHTGIKTM